MTDGASINTPGGRIRTLRELLGMTQSELARRICCTQAAISQFESNKVTPTLANQRALAEELGTKRRLLFRELVEAEDHEAAA